MPLIPVDLPWGDAGTEQTLGYMRTLCYQAVALQVVRQAALSIIRAVPPRDTFAQVAAIRDFLATRIHFVDDPLGVELVHPPAYLLGEISARYYVAGDCDDVAVLGASLAGSIGMPSRFVVLGFGDARAPMHHVYTEVSPNGGRTWCDLDTTRPLGEYQSRDSVARRWVVPALPDWG